MPSFPGFFVPVSLERLLRPDLDAPGERLSDEEVREGFYAFQRALEEWLNDVGDGLTGGGSGDTLWQSVGNVLFPITAPDEFLVIGTDGWSDIDFDTLNADLNIRMMEDINLAANRDVNISAGFHGNSSTLAGDVNIEARSGTGFSTGNLNLNTVGSGAVIVNGKVSFSTHESAATGPVGNVVGKVAIYTTGAVLIGYVAVYDAIT